MPAAPASPVPPTAWAPPPGNSTPTPTRPPREPAPEPGGPSLAGSPNGLVAALRKLDAYAQRIPLEQPNPAMNNLFIIEPMMGSSVMKLFASHPPTEDRIAALLRR